MTRPDGVGQELDVAEVTRGSDEVDQVLHGGGVHGVGFTGETTPAKNDGFLSANNESGLAHDLIVGKGRCLVF